MDLYDAKARIAEAFVESIFRRARFDVRAYDARPTLRIGHEDFSPNFTASRDDHAERLIAVKYRPSVEQFLALEGQRRETSIFVLARRLWPTLCFVFVTDRPRVGRSCFQAIPLPAASAPPFAAVDLVALSELALFQHNIDDHERLLLRLLDLITHG